MILDNGQADTTILIEIGKRLAKQRLEMNLTQAELAHKAGVSKSTLERIESGKSTQLTNFIRILRSLNLIHAMDSFLPKTRPGPIELIKNKGKERKRANPKRKKDKPEKTWSWGDGS
jgi:transcriptional regulator with XRE-family HTH domain